MDVFFLRNRNDIDFVFTKTQSCFDCFHESGTIFVADRDPILNHLHACAETLDFFVGIDAHDLVVDPNAQVALLLEKIKERARLRFRGDGNPESNENRLAVQVMQDVIGD